MVQYYSPDAEVTHMKFSKNVMVGFLFLFGVMLLLVIGLGEVSGETITVDENGNGDYEKIQDAINAAGEGDTIRVWEGTYYENVVVNKTVSLIGNGSAITIIDGGRGGDVVVINSKKTNISGFSLTNSSLYTHQHNNFKAGLLVKASYCRIENNSLFDNQYGIYLHNAENNSIWRNSCFENKEWNYPSGAGIMLAHSDGNIIANNRCYRNEGDGIFAYISDENEIVNNTSEKNDGSGILVSGECGFNIIRGNYCTSNGKNGIRVGYYCWLCEVSENDCSGNENGLSISRTYECLVFGNNVTNNKNNGIFVFEGDHDRILNNSCCNNGNSGIEIEYSFGVCVENNSIVGNKYGIRMRFHEKNGKWGEEGNTNVIGNNNFSDNVHDIVTYNDRTWELVDYCLLTTFIIVIVIFLFLLRKWVKNRQDRD